MIEKQLYIPSNLDLGGVLTEREYNRHADKYHYIVHKIFEERVLSGSKGEWVSLSSTLMQKVVGTEQYMKIKNFLLDNKIIETDGIYSDGGNGDRYGVYEPKCYYYRIGEHYRNVRTKKMMILDEAFAAKLDRLRGISQREITQDHVRFLQFNLNELIIDDTNAHLEVLKRLSTVGEYSIEKANCDTIAICQINNKEFRTSRDSAGHRVHNNITNLSKWIRPYLSVPSGKQLYNCDIRNSQPLLLSVLLKDKYPENAPDDVSRYIQLCETGQFYEYLMEQFGLDPATTDRKAFKKEVFAKIFYCRNSESYQYQEWKQFQILFPNVSQVIKEYKKTDYKKLSIAMQSAESKIIIDGVIRTLSDQYKCGNFFALTCHDSLIVEEDNVDEVIDLMYKEFARYGLNPSINPEKL